MAMILDAFIGKLTEVLSGFAKEKVVMVLGVKDEMQKLRMRMLMIQSILEDAEKKKFEDSAINIWLSQLKDVMYDADDIIDLCRIQGAQLLAADQKKPNKSTKPQIKYLKTGDGLRTQPSTSGSSAANYLDIRSLMDLTCQAVANKIKDKSSEEVRHIFNIKNDFTHSGQAITRKINGVPRIDYSYNKKN